MALKDDLKKLVFDPEHRKTSADFIRVIVLRVLQLSLSLATAYFLVRALSQEQFGEYHYVLAWMGVLSIFGLPGLNDAVMQAVARDKLGSYKKSAFYAVSFSLIGALGLLAQGGWFLFFGDNRELGLGLIFSSFAFPLVHGMLTWKAYRQGIKDFKTLLRLEGMNSILMGCLLIGGLLLFPGYILIPLAIVLLVPGLQNLVQTVRTYKALPLEAEIEEGNLHFGLKTTLYSVLSVAANHIDKLLLFTFLSPVDLAIFMAAQKLTEPVQNITQDLAAVLAPKFAQYTHLTQNLDRFFYGVAAFFGLGILIFSFTLLPPVMLLIFGEAYASAIPYCQALMVSVIFGNVASLRFRFIRSRMNIDSVRAIILGNALFRIVASTVCIYTMGIVGAVVAIFLTRIALAVQVHFDIQKFRETHRPNNN